MPGSGQKSDPDKSRTRTKVVRIRNTVYAVPAAIKSYDESLPCEKWACKHFFFRTYSLLLKIPKVLYFKK
jgi:hypothetical protein